MRKIAILLLLALNVSCTEARVKKYQDILDPLLGSAKKEGVDRELGRPTFCKTLAVGERCEYRTARGRNDPIPTSSRKTPFGPDLSPYEYFDVLEVEFDGMGIFKDWNAVVIKQ